VIAFALGLPFRLRCSLFAINSRFAALGEATEADRSDRFLWARLSQFWSTLVMVKPETVIAWHRQGFRVVSTWKVRRGQPGRPPVSSEIPKLIRQMSRESPLWGAPIHGELPKLGIDIGETSVASIWARPKATVADLGNLPGKSLPVYGIGRLLHGADHSFSSAVRFPGPGSRP
jgi:hypothetical protein